MDDSSALSGEPNGRQPWLDSLRVLAVIGVVVQHACITRWMSLSGIPWGARALLGVASCSVSCLMLVAGYTSTLSPAFGIRTKGYPLSRLRRLGLPYLAWTVVFVLAQNYLPYGRPVGGLTIWDLLTGSGVYVVLWFLPALFYASVVGWAIRSLEWRLIAAFAATLLFLFQPVIAARVPVAVSGFFGVVVGLAPWVALYLWGQSAAAIPAGLFESRTAMTALVALGLIALTLCALMSAQYYPVWPGSLPIEFWLSGSVGVFALLLVARSRPGWRLFPQLSAVTLGVYMMHLPLLSLASRLAPTAVIPWFVWIPANVALFVAVTGGISLALSRTPLRVLVN